MGHKIIPWKPLFALLISVCFLAVGARADTFQIQFTQSSTNMVVDTEFFTTDSTCITCSQGTGLLTFTANLGTDIGANAFDLTDDTNDLQFFKPSSSFLLNASLITSSETGDTLNLQVPGFPGNWAIFRSDQTPTGFAGTYTITAVSVVATPEPSALVLFGVGLLGVGWVIRRERQGGPPFRVRASHN